MKTLIAILALVAVGAGAFAWHEHGQLGTALAAASAATQASLAADFEASAARADVQRVIVYADRVRVVHDTITTIRKEIPRHVTPEVDRAFPLSVGFVRVLDAAAAGVPIAEDSQRLDAQASTVAPSDAASVVAGNYGSCLENAATLEAVQAWAVDHGFADPTP
jgi:hypothetical protein